MEVQNTIKLTTTTPSSGATTQPTSAEDVLLKFASPGQVLQVEVAQNSSGDRGVLIQGKFYKATLPPQYALGQDLLVEVQPSTDALVLKVLTASVQGSFKDYLSIKSIIETILPKLDLPTLTLSPDTSTISLGGKASIFTGLTAPTAAEMIIQRPILNALQNSTFLQPLNLETPDSTWNILQNLSKSDLVRILKDATDAVGKLSEERLPLPQLKFLQSLETELRNFAKPTSKLTFDTRNEGRVALSDQLRVYLSVSQLAVESGMSQFLPDIARNVSQIKLSDNPLLLLMNGLNTVQLMHEDGGTVPEKRFVDLIRSLAVELKDLKDARADDKKIRTLLTTYADKIKNDFGPEFKRGDEIAALHTGQMALKLAGDMARTQSTLNDLNPLMRSLGEPALFFIPFLGGGLLARWEMSVSGGQLPITLGKENKKKTLRADKFERIDLFITLPNLGDLGITIAHRADEVFLTITSPEGSIADFLKGKSELFKTKLKELGFTSPAIQMKFGEPNSAIPGWYHSLVSEKKIA